VALVLVAALIVAGLGAAVAGAVGTRFAGGAGSGRYDFWRVAWSQLARDPILGAGADNFAHDYARERRGHEEPLYPHSIEWRTLGQTGVVGAVLLAGFFAAACAGVRRSSADPVTVAALVSAAAWLAHATIDWQWELPALGAPAMACLGIVAARPGQPRAGPPVPGRLRLAATVAMVAAAVSFALPALAAREIEQGVAVWDRDPAAGRDRLARAHTLNPLSDRADVIAGTLALEDGDAAEAGRAFRRAAERDAGNWYAQAQLGLVELLRGRRAAAIAALRRARRLNPNEFEIGLALEAARAGRPLPAGLAAALAGEAVPGPRARHPVDCRPVLGLGRDCAAP
jgi:tetratricopeptide (TPR) repeat protein